MRSEGKIYHDDWMNNGLPDKSVQLIIADPPYFETKGDFDFVWKTFDDYLIDVEKWAIECKSIMKWETNDVKQYGLNPNCFEKTKVRWGIFKRLSPQTFNRSNNVAHIRHNNKYTQLPPIFL